MSNVGGKCFLSDNGKETRGSPNGLGLCRMGVSQQYLNTLKHPNLEIQTSMSNQGC